MTSNDNGNDMDSVSVSDNDKWYVTTDLQIAHNSKV